MEQMVVEKYKNFGRTAHNLSPSTLFHLQVVSYIILWTMGRGAPPLQPSLVFHCTWDKRASFHGLA